MRGSDRRTEGLFSYVSCERRCRRSIRCGRSCPWPMPRCRSLSPDFQQLYALNGRPSIAPEKLLRALLLQAFYSVRSERQLMEQLDYNLLFRWFVGLGVDDPVWDVTVFTKNRDRLLEGAIAAKFLRAVLAQPKVEALLSDEHFSVDGTLIQAWASMKTFRPKDGSGEPPAPGRNGERDFNGEQRANDTHASTTDPDARLFRKGKGKEAKLCFMGHLLMENRHGLIVDWPARRGQRHRGAGRGRSDGRGDPRSAPDHGRWRQELRHRRLRRRLHELNATPHVAQNTSNRRSAIDRRTTAIRATRSASASASGSRRRSAGSRRSPCSGVPGTAARSGRLAVHPGGRGLQPDPAAQAAGGVMAKRHERPLRGHRCHPASATARHSRPDAARRQRSSAAQPALFPQPALMFAVKYLVASVWPCLLADGMLA